MAGQVQSKLHLILKKMEVLEKQNSELEHKLDTTTAGGGNNCVKVTHSSPERSHKCNSPCTSQHSKKRCSRLAHSKLHDSSDEDLIPSKLEQSSQLSSSHASNFSEVVSDHVSMDFLKNDEQVQQKVQRQFQCLQDKEKHSSAGNKLFKSGFLRSGDNAVKQGISWPHHHCFLGQGGQLLEYKDLSPMQFMVGFLGCLQYKPSATIKNN